MRRHDTYFPIEVARVSQHLENRYAVAESHRIMRYYVYVLLRSDRRRTYVGWTVDLGDRLAKHNAGLGAKFTRGQSWRLVYAERHPTRSEAMSRESKLKRDRAFRALLRLG
jgi:putative endonuclease